MSQTIYVLVIFAVAGLIVYFVPMDAKIKTVLGAIIGIAAVLFVLFVAFPGLR